MKRPLCTVYLVVAGDTYKAYARRLVLDLEEHWLPGRTEIVVLPGATDAGRRGWEAPSWSLVAATRYRVALENRMRLRGEYVFQLDADMRVLKTVGEEILCENGLTVTTHPGFPPDSDPANWPYERNTYSVAYVPYGQEGEQYHPGALVGGSRLEFFELADVIAQGVEYDLAGGFYARWYEESHLNHQLADRPLWRKTVLDRRYCWWQQWGDPDHEAVVMHLDKTPEELAARG